MRFCILSIGFGFINFSNQCSYFSTSDLTFPVLISCFWFWQVFGIYFPKILSKLPTGSEILKYWNSKEFFFELLIILISHDIHGGLPEKLSCWFVGIKWLESPKWKFVDRIKDDRGYNDFYHVEILWDVWKLLTLKFNIILRKIFEYIEIWLK